MEWVETTGRTVEEAKELALDQLGVDDREAEFEILEEPRSGLFGRSRGNARVKARVLPVAPPPKTERRRRSKKGERSEGAGNGRGSRRGSTTSTASAEGDDGAPSGGTTEDTRAAEPATETRTTAGSGSSGRERGGRRGGGGGGDPTPRERMDVEDQTRVLEEFLVELASGFGLEVSASSTCVDNELTVDLSGDGLGHLVGPRLATLDAVQEIARNTLQRHAAGREYAKVVVDVEGIRARRRDSLTSFVRDAARQVLDDDVEVVFEVMSSADRKQVHDVAAELDGVASTSEGEDPRRRVVLRRA